MGGPDRVIHDHRSHRPRPIMAPTPEDRALALAAVGEILIVWVMYGTHSRQIELVGFLLLSLASVWDWRLLTCASESKATH